MNLLEELRRLLDDLIEDFHELITTEHRGPVRIELTPGEPVQNLKE